MSIEGSGSIHPLTLSSQKEEEISKIFKELDQNNSGYLEFAELCSLVQQLGEEGRSVSQTDILAAIEAIDLNGDRKISYPEFLEWWVKGRKGKLLYILKGRKALMASINRAISLTDKRSRSSSKSPSKSPSQNEEIPSAGGASAALTADAASEIKPRKYSIMLSLNKVGKPPGSLGFFSKDATPSSSEQVSGARLEVVTNKKQLASGLEDLKNRAGKVSFITIELPCMDPESLKNNLTESLLAILNKGGLLPESIDSLFSNPFLKIEMITTEESLIIQFDIHKTLSAIFGSQFAMLNQMISPQSYINLSAEFCLFSNLKDIIETETVQLILTKGFKIELNIETNNKNLLQLITTVFSQFTTVSNSLSNCKLIKFSLALRSPEELKQFADKIGLGSLLFSGPRATDLVSFIHNSLNQFKQSSDGEDKEFLRYGKQVLEHLIKAVFNPVKITFAIPNLLTKVIFSAENISLLYKAILSKPNQ